MARPDPMDPRMTAGIDLARRVGARTFQLRYSDDEEPVVWMAVAGFSQRNGRPVASGKVNAHVVGAALEPVGAVLSLLDELIDGAECQHCHRPAGVAHDLDEMPLGDHVCWYQFDPELATYRRACEGDT
jgi:hypothetical protein